MKATARSVMAALALLVGAATAQAAVNVWQQSLPGTTVYSVATGPRPGAPTESDLYVGVGTNSPYGTGVLKSTDGGQTWAKVASYTYVNGLSTDFRIPGRVYAATSTGLFRSDDAGATWTASPLKAEIRSSIAVSMIDSNVLYGDNYRSTDGGASWTLMTGAPPHYGNAGATRISPADPNVVYSIGSGVAAASSDGGLTWELLRSGTTTIWGISDVALHPTSVETRYVSSRYGSWNKRYAPGVTTSFLAGTPVFALALDPSAPEKVYAISTGGVRRSLDGGATWGPYGGPGSYNVPQARAVFDDLTGKLHVPGDGYVTTWNSAGLWSVETRGAQTCTDADGDTFFLEGPVCGTAADCNDNNPAIRPNATEICDGVDNDCDALTDENVTQTFYRDFDADTWGIASTTQQACTQPSDYTYRAGDCNEANAAINPGAVEVCTDGVDNNCNGLTDCSDYICSGNPACQSACQAPGNPTNATATAGKKLITLTWSAGGGTRTAFRVYKSLDGSSFTFRASVGATILTYKDTGLTTGKKYYYYIKAWNDCDADGVVDAGEESGPTNTVSATSK